MRRHFRFAITYSWYTWFITAASSVRVSPSTCTDWYMPSSSESLMSLSDSVPELNSFIEVRVTMRALQVSIFVGYIGCFRNPRTGLTHESLRRNNQTKRWHQNRGPEHEALLNLLKAYRHRRRNWAQGAQKNTGKK